MKFLSGWKAWNLQDSRSNAKLVGIYSGMGRALRQDGVEVQEAHPIFCSIFYTELNELSRMTRFS
jgi:hypothetical protein